MRTLRFVYESRDGLRGSCSSSRHRVERQIDVDGVGAFDHVLRAAMLSKVAEVPSLRVFLPFVEAAYARPSSYVRVDEEGVRHTIEQHEGGEQEDPLILLLFSLGIHKASQEIQPSSLLNAVSRVWRGCIKRYTWVAVFDENTRFSGHECWKSSQRIKEF